MSNGVQERLSSRARDIAAMIRQERTARGMSRSDLAIAVNPETDFFVSKEIIRSIEDGRNVCFSFDLMIPVLNVLGVSLERYLHLSGIP